MLHWFREASITKCVGGVLFFSLLSLWQYASGTTLRWALLFVVFFTCAYALLLAYRLHGIRRSLVSDTQDTPTDIEEADPYAEAYGEIVIKP